MKVTVKEYNSVASWKWVLPGAADGDTCGICRVEFEGACTKCKFPGDECPVNIGQCGHCFHMHCIESWTSSESSQGRCPMCRQLFVERVAVPETNTSWPPDGAANAQQTPAAQAGQGDLPMPTTPARGNSNGR